MNLTKKIFLVSTLLLVFTLLLWGVYVLSFKKTSGPALSENPFESLVKKEGDAPVDAKKDAPQAIFSISDEAVIAPTLSEDGKYVKYYSAETGLAYQIDLEGQNKKALSDKELPDLSNVFWSPNKNKVISQFKKEKSATFFYYNYSDNSVAKLKDNLDDAVWQSDNKILYKFYNPKTNERTLNIADPNGSNWKKIADFKDKSVSIAPIPKSGLVSFWNKSDAYAETALQSASVLSSEQKTIFKDKFGTDYLWSGDGGNILLSHSDAKGGTKTQLALVNARGGEYKNLNIPTFVSKCVWSADHKTVYYALPSGIPDSAVLPNDYQDQKFNTADTFWKVDTESGEKKRLVDLDKITEKLDASSLFLSADESALFFVNRIDGRLNRINL